MRARENLYGQSGIDFYQILEARLAAVKRDIRRGKVSPEQAKDQLAGELEKHEHRYLNGWKHSKFWILIGIALIIVGFVQSFGSTVPQSSYILLLSGICVLWIAVRYRKYSRRMLFVLDDFVEDHFPTKS